MSYSETSNVMDMPDERDVDIAKQIINTVIYNIENEDVNSMTEHEIKNYFMMSQQIEIYDEKFRAKGYYLVYDPVKGTSLTDSPNNCMKYDLAKLADRLLDKFCHRLRSMHLLGPAVKIYIDTYGTSRFSRFLQSSTATRKATAFDLKNVLRRACEGGYNLEGPLFMDCLEAIAMGPRGMTRVKDLVNEYVYQDESAETLVAMLAAENQEARYITEIKHTILEKLEKRFAEKPDSRMWLLIICSHNLVHAANNFPPAIELFLRFIISLSDSINYDQDRKDYYSSPGQLTYRNLIHIMSKFYRNPKTTQHIINFIFKQYACNPSVWGSALQACHNHPEEDSTAQQFYDSLYGGALTDPNLSRESLQMVLSKKC